MGKSRLACAQFSSSSNQNGSFSSKSFAVLSSALSTSAVASNVDKRTMGSGFISSRKIFNDVDDGRLLVEEETKCVETGLLTLGHHASTQESATNMTSRMDKTDLMI